MSGSMKKDRSIDFVSPVAVDILSALSIFDGRVCGSIRREMDTVGDIDVVVIAPLKTVSELLERMCKVHGYGFETLSNMEKVKKSAHFLVNGIQVDVYQASREDWGGLVLFLTGSATFNIMMRAAAKKKGLKLSQYGLFRGEECIASRTEREIFLALGLRYVEPKDRSFKTFGKLERR